MLEVTVLVADEGEIVVCEVLDTLRMLVATEDAVFDVAA